MTVVVFLLAWVVGYLLGLWLEFWPGIALAVLAGFAIGVAGVMLEDRA